MAHTLTVRDIEAIDFQRRERVFQLVAQAILVLVLVAGALGLFGGGPVSSTRAAHPDGATTVEFERFLRYSSVTRLRIDLGPEAVDNGVATLIVSRGLIDDMRIDNVHPAPDGTISTREDVRYQFTADPGSPPSVTVTYRPDSFGVTKGTVRASGGAPIDVWQLVYP